MFTPDNQNKRTHQRHHNTAQDTDDLNAMLRRKIVFIFAVAIVVYPIIALMALIVVIYMAKNIDIIRLLPLVLSPIGTTGGFSLIAKRMLPVDPDWLLLEREKLRFHEQGRDERTKEENP